MLNDIRNLERTMIQNQWGTLHDLEETNYYEITNVLAAKEHDEYINEQKAGGYKRDKFGNEIVPLGFMVEDNSIMKH